MALLTLAPWGAMPAGQSPSAAARRPSATRVVSLVPAVTEMLFAVGAGPRVVAVSSFDRFPAAVDTLPRVGALLDPDTERILSLKPNLVVVYASQTDLQSQFARVGIRTYVHRHGGLEDALRTIEEIGVETGREDAARAVVGNLRARLDALRRRTAGRPKPRTLLVFGRQPGSLRGVYASGGVGFLHDLLDVAGGDNVFREVKRESVQPSQETLITLRPDVIVELHAVPSRNDAAETTRVWSTLRSAPAVREDRVHSLDGPQLVIAGPRLADAAEQLARAIHPEAF